MYRRLGYKPRSPSRLWLRGFVEGLDRGLTQRPRKGVDLVDGPAEVTSASFTLPECQGVVRTGIQSEGSQSCEKTVEVKSPVRAVAADEIVVPVTVFGSGDEELEELTLGRPPGFV